MASILGNPNVFIESGSVLNLTCVVKHAISKPAFIIWKHGTKVSKNLISVLCCTRGNLNTDYGRMMSTFQIINGQIMIQAQTFLKKSETFEEKWLIHAKSRTRDEICTESAIKNTPNILRFTWSKNFSHYLALSIWFRT